MKKCYEEHFSKLIPIVQALLEYYLDPYRIDESSLEVSNDDARKIMKYYNFSPVISRKPSIKRILKKYLNEHLTQHQREIAVKYESESERIKEQIEVEEIAIKDYKKKITNEQELLMDKHEEFALQCSSKTQAVIRYEDCRRLPTEGRSGFHGFVTPDQIPFYICGWATYKGSWGGTEYGVAFRVNRDCFN